MSLSNLFVVIPSYSPNIATTNRIIAFLRGFSECGVFVSVTFLISDGKDSICNEYIPNVTYEYMWKLFPIKNRLLRQIQLEYNSRKYVKNLPSGASVFLPWPSSNLLSLLVKRKDLRVYYEETELPELYQMRRFNIESYMDSIHKTSSVFVISSALKDYFVHHGIAPENVQIVNMIVDTSRFDKIEKKTPKDKYIAYCGTVTSNKDGVDDLITAFAKVHIAYPDIKLYIIGPIPQNIETSDFVGLVNKYGLNDSVHFTGVVNYTDMPQILKDAEVLVLARPDNVQAKYGFPTKLGEYLFTGNPVVVTNVGDIPLFLKDGESALIVEPNQPKRFAEKIIWCLDNKEKSRNIGGVGRQVATRCFNYNIEAKKIINTIEGL